MTPAQHKAAAEEWLVVADAEVMKSGRRGPNPTAKWWHSYAMQSAAIHALLAQVRES